MKRKFRQSKFYTLSLLLLIIIILSNTAAAFQLSPAAKRLTYAPGAQESYALRVINDDRAAIEVNLTAAGPPGQDVSFDPASFAMAPQDAERLVTVTLREPMDPAGLSPGDNAIAITVTAAPAAGAGQFGGAISLLHNLVVTRLYAGSYLDGALLAPDTAPGSPSSLTLSLANKGDAATDMSGSAAITTPSGAAVSDVPLGSATIAGNSEGKLEGAWSTTPDTAPGRYVANATIRYDDNGTAVERRYAAAFRVGSPTLRLTMPAGPLQLRAGEIARLPVSGALIWNEPVEAYALTTLLDGDGNALVTGRSATMMFQPGAETIIPSFLDVPAGAVGNGTLLVSVYETAGGLLAEARQEATLAQPAGAAAAPSGASRTSLVAALAVALLVLILLAAWLLRRGRRGKGAVTDAAMEGGAAGAAAGTAAGATSGEAPEGEASENGAAGQSSDSRAQGE